MKNSLLTLALGVFLVGCATSGRPIDHGKVDQIENGVTNRAEVEAMLGKPTSITRTRTDLGEETVLMYIHSKAQVKGETFIPLVGGFVGGARSTAEVVMVHIGADGLVMEVTSSESNTDVGGFSNMNTTTNRPASTKGGGLR